MKLVSLTAKRELIKRAREFNRALSGESDCGYVNKDNNEIALVGFIMGFMRAQLYWRRYEKYCCKHHPREDVYAVAEFEAWEVFEEVTGEPFGK